MKIVESGALECESAGGVPALGVRGGKGCAHVLQEAGPQLAEMGALTVDPSLQGSHESALAAVDVLDVAEDDAQLLFAEHVGAPAALAEVALRGGGVLFWGGGVSTFPPPRPSSPRDPLGRRPSPRRCRAGA